MDKIAKFQNTLLFIIILVVLVSYIVLETLIPGDLQNGLQWSIIFFIVDCIIFLLIFITQTFLIIKSKRDKTPTDSIFIIKSVVVYLLTLLSIPIVFYLHFSL